MTEAGPRGRDIGRLNAFTDGVMVVAMTILILNVELPESVANLDGAQLVTALLALWPKYLGYVLSFLVIGQYWLGYTRQFGTMRESDEGFAQLNILLLLVIGFIPFATALVSRNNGRIATVVYAATMMAASVLLLALWLYAIRKGLVEAGEAPGWRWRETAGSIEAIAVFALSIGVAQFDSHLARWTWLLLAVPVRKWPAAKAV